MKTQYRIGSGKENEIVLRDKNCPNLLAEINYYRGNWILKKIEESNIIFVNGEKIEEPRQLSKNDKISVCKQTIYWSNYFFEGESQELNFKDIISFNGRISRSNFRALSLLSIGLSICVFFLPGLLIGLSPTNTDGLNEMANTQTIAPIIHTIGFSLIGIVLLLLAIKRMRDTGNSIWKVWIPLYNLKLLYFEPSKR